MLILAIETSCDETSVAILETKDKNKNFIILSNVVSSQVKLHAKYGGVVPFLAAREHTKNILPCLKKAISLAEIKDLQKIDFIAVTKGPGLMPALLVGLNTAKSLSYILNKPLLGINHIEGHIYSNWILSAGEILNSKFQIPKNFPILCLIVSGGHTQLVLMKNYGKYKILGETQDDAAGEAFDKVAKILNLSYPGGPIIAKLAQKGNPNAIKFPRPMMYTKDYNFSFSGLKTAVLYEARKQCQCHPEFISGSRKSTKKQEILNQVCPRLRLEVQHNKIVTDFCASFQQAVIDVLVHKTIKAAQEYKVKAVMLSGGVSANQELRKSLQEKVSKENIDFYAPDLQYCGDNAAMIAVAAYFKLKNKKNFDGWENLEADANLRL